MKNKKIFLLLILFISNLSLSNNKLPFWVGENLIFDLKYGIIKAAEAKMQITNFDKVYDADVFHSKFSVDTTPTFSFFYKVEDRYETYFDVKDYFSWKFSQKIKEGSYRREFYATFDYNNNIAQTNFGDFPISTKVNDVISAFYFTRTIDYKDFKPGQKIYLSNFYKDKTHPLEVKFLGRQKINVPAGTFNCIVIEPFMKEGALFKSEGRVLVYLSDDELKIPILIKTKVLIGSIDAELKSYSGLNGNLKSKVK